MPRISKVYQVAEKEFCEIVANSNSYCDCARKLGLSPYGANSTIQIKKRIAELNCDISHFSQTANANNVSTKYSLAEILVEDSNYNNRTSLKKRILDEKLLEYKCVLCGNTGEWMGKELSLQLDHKNGKNNDHRLENLRFLCPNCHSQTETYAGKNK